MDDRSDRPPPPDPTPDGGPPAAPPITALPAGVTAIDTLTAGLQEVTAGYLLEAPRPTLVECGPARTAATVIAGLRSLGFDPDDLAYLVLTHIHLDHAGGAGDLAVAFPNARIVVSELGARHLHDPTKLNASSKRVYGPLFDTVYGPCTPIDERRILGVADGDELDLGGGRTLELLHTPGHAKHHIGIHDPSNGLVFTGDSVGVKLPEMTSIRPATPPADFHLDAALDSIARYREREPGTVYLAHYGAVTPPDAALAEAADRLRLWAEVAEAALREAQTRGLDEQHELDHVAETLAQRFAQSTDQLPDDVASRIELLNDTRANAAGLLRYLHRRDAGTLTPLG